MNTINNILKRYKEISLDELDALNLLNRIDTKFTFSIHQLPHILEQLSVQYNVLSINGNTHFLYKTIYYDTQEYDMYLKHHNGNLTRSKIRHRTYLENNTTFLEIKSKNNKGQTLKDRIQVAAINSNWTEGEKKIISGKTAYEPMLLKAMVQVNYTRITLANKDSNEKITIDIDLEFSNTESKNKLNGIAILEVKQAKRAKTLVFTVLKENGIKPVSFSKYCMGFNFLYPQIKKNNFKKKLITLNKIKSHGIISPVAGI